MCLNPSLVARMSHMHAYARRGGTSEYEGGTCRCSTPFFPLPHFRNRAASLLPSYVAAPPLCVAIAAPATLLASVLILDAHNFQAFDQTSLPVPYIVVLLTRLPL